MSARPSNELWDHQVRATRTRMLFSLVPMVAPVGGSFAIVVLLYFRHLQPEVITTSALIWAITTFLIESSAGVHSWMYLRSRDRQRPTWRQRLIAHVTLTSGCWASSVWLIPLHDAPELRATLVGSVMGVAATGAFIYYAEQRVARLFFMPILLSTGLYCLLLWCLPQIAPFKGRYRARY